VPCQYAEALELADTSAQSKETSPIGAFPMDETPCPLNTRKRFCISIVVLVLNITLRPIPIIAQRSAEPPSVEKQAKSPSQPRKNADGTDNVPDNDLRGTDTSPITVKILPTMNTKEETAQ